MRLHNDAANSFNQELLKYKYEYECQYRNMFNNGAWLFMHIYESELQKYSLQKWSCPAMIVQHW